MGCTSSKNGELEDSESRPGSPYEENRRASVNQLGEEETSAEEELIALKMIADAEHEAMEELQGDNDDEDSSENGGIAAPSMDVSDDDDALSIPTMIQEEPEHAPKSHELEVTQAQEAASSAKAEQAAAVAAKHAAEAEKARVEAELAEMKAETEALKAEAERAKAEAEHAKAEAEAEKARAQSETLQAQAEMSAALEATAEAEVLTAEAEAAKAAAEAEKAAAEAGADAAKADLETLVRTKDEAQAEVARVTEEAKAAQIAAAEAADARDAAKAEALATMEAAATAKAEAAATEEAAATAKAEAAATEEAAATAKAEAAATEEAAVTAKGEAEAAEKTAAEATEEAAAAVKEEDQIDADAAGGEKSAEAAPTAPVPAQVSAPTATDSPKMNRKAGNDQANGRMFKEMASIKRRENSLLNRKKASAFAMGVARDKKMSFGGGGVTLGVDKPLVVRKSIRAQKKGSLSGLKGVSEEPSTPAKRLGAELNLVTPPPAGGHMLAPATSTPMSSRKSVRKSIRHMFKSTRGRAKSRRGGPVDAADSSPKKAVGSPKRKPGAVTVAEIDAGLPAGDEYETLDVRAVDAARWTDKVVRQLIDEITQRGEKNSAGQYVITFGKLFDETANIFDALVGIIKTAKKYHVVHADKDQLWQGQDDNEIITLLKDTHSGVLINRRHRTKVGGGTPAKTKGFGGNSMANQQSKCHVCGKTVYPMEFVGASDKAFHKSCFRCKTCNCMLKANDYCNVKDEFYCPTHYKELINLAGGPGQEAL